MNKMIITGFLQSALCLLATHHMLQGATSRAGHAFAPPGDTIKNVNMMFFVEHGHHNDMDLYNHPFFRDKTDDFVFHAPGSPPEGFVLTDQGVASWTPTTQQFAALQSNASAVGFTAYSRAREQLVTGEIRLVAKGEIADADSIPSEIPPAIVVPDTTGTSTSPAAPLAYSFPDREGWNEKDENQTFSFELTPRGGSGNYTFELLEPEHLMANLDKYGQFKWTPPYDYVAPDEKMRTISLKIRLFDDAGNDAVKTARLVVWHVNRPPEVNTLPAFYIQYNKENTYQIKETGLVYDPDGDSIIYKPVLKDLPQKMHLDANGTVSWKPSVSQFNSLRSNPFNITFTVEDHPAGQKSVGQLRVLASQQDLPPQITMVPNEETFAIEENEALKLNFFITDPNGTEDLLTFGFVSENSSISDESLERRDVGHYEFEWTPGFDFIHKAGGKEIFNVNFFAVDKENNRTEVNIEVTVSDTENLLEKDRILYDQYRTALERAWDLIKQLDEKESELEKEYKRAKRGKKNRAIGTASVGALTGLSPVVFMENQSGQKVLAGVGGTATATIGTLEASNVIGESPSDVMRNLGYVSQKKNDLLVYGNIFASKYALPLDRREKGFANDLKSLTIQLNLKDVHQLELDAAWENPKDATDKNIRKVFKDFNPDPRFADDYK